MGVFQTSRFFPVAVLDLGPVADDVVQHFKAQDFEVIKQPSLGGSWDIDIHRGGLFKAVLGMKTALKIDIEPAPHGTLAKAGVGIIGAQTVPTVISMLFFWPVLVTQIWGVIQQSRLDDQAMEVIGNSLSAHSTTQVAPGLAAVNRACTSCGKPVPDNARFCPNCGAALG